jgi:hypothetical protein
LEKILHEKEMSGVKTTKFIRRAGSLGSGPTRFTTEAATNDSAKAEVLGMLNLDKPKRQLQVRSARAQTQQPFLLAVFPLIIGRSLFVYTSLPY